MRCDVVLDRILEADPADLRGEGGTELARHIAGCPRCAPVAAALLEETERVDRALADWAEGGAAGPADAADAAIDAALATARGPERGDAAALTDGLQGRSRRAPARPSTRHWARRAWIPLATAAALAGVLMLARREAPVPAGSTAAGPAIEPRVAVSPPADRGAAIMETENPNITIVWLYEREES